MDGWATSLSGAGASLATVTVFQQRKHSGLKASPAPTFPFPGSSCLGDWSSPSCLFLSHVVSTAWSLNQFKLSDQKCRLLGGEPGQQGLSDLIPLSLKSWVMGIKLLIWICFLLPEPGSLMPTMWNWLRRGKEAMASCSACHKQLINDGLCHEYFYSMQSCTGINE